MPYLFLQSLWQVWTQCGELEQFWLSLWMELEIMFDKISVLHDEAITLGTLHSFKTLVLAWRTDKIWDWKPNLDSSNEEYFINTRFDCSTFTERPRVFTVTSWTHKTVLLSKFFFCVQKSMSIMIQVMWNVTPCQTVNLPKFRWKLFRVKHS